MSSDNNNPSDLNHPRRGSVTQQALAGLFRSNSISVTNNMQSGEPGRRRLSVSTTGIGLTGTSPTSANAFSNFRRSSMSTNSESIDENAIDEDEMARAAPTTPFPRRMSFGTSQNMRNMRNGAGSPGSSTNGNHLSPSNALTQNTPATAGRRSSLVPRGAPSQQDQGFNWSEQLRSRAESSVQGSRPSFGFTSALSTSPRSNGQANGNHHDRAKSISDMPAPPAAQPKPSEPQRQKPDAFQERILKGDFYMD